MSEINNNFIQVFFNGSASGGTHRATTSCQEDSPFKLNQRKLEVLDRSDAESWILVSLSSDADWAAKSSLHFEIAFKTSTNCIKIT